MELNAWIGANTFPIDCFRGRILECISTEVIAKLKKNKLEVTSYGVFSANEAGYYQFLQKCMKVVTVKYKKILDMKYF